MKKFVFLATWRLGGRSLKRNSLAGAAGYEDIFKANRGYRRRLTKHDVELPTQVFSAGFPPSRE
ncbi:MAG: hypothetical protein R3B84_23245 [Zavarzinella sp.]